MKGARHDFLDASVPAEREVPLSSGWSVHFHPIHSPSSTYQHGSRRRREDHVNDGYISVRTGFVPSERAFPRWYDRSPLTPWSRGTKMTASTLSQYTKIQAKLQLEIMDVKAEVQRLKNELKKDQDPAKMGRIQKQIGVCYFPTPSRKGLMDSN
jgi:hypothetical protein